MNEVLVTVYITNYNYEKYIKQAIESVLNQSLQDFELLIIDDGSTDNSKSIIENYSAHPQVKIIYQQNKGLNITNNIALQLAAGKYIMRLDADDYLAHNALEKMVALLEANKNLGLVFPDYYLVDHDNNITAEIKRHDFNEEVTLLDQPAHGACTLIRKEFLKSVGGYDESYSCQDGYELWIKFITHYKVTNIKEPLFYYRRHGENLTTNENRILDTRRIINNNFISKHQIALPKTVGIIPVRNTRLYKNALAFTALGEKNLLDIKIGSSLQSDLLQKVVITSEDQLVLEYVKNKYASNKKVVLVERPEEFARYNVTLIDTIEHILNSKQFDISTFDAFMILPIEYPFLGSKLIDDAIHSLTIFNAESLISVRIERATMYHHYGEGMVPILNQENFKRLEREALYKGVGGITLSKINAFKQSRKLLSGKVGHIVVDEKSALGIFTPFDLVIAQLVYDKEKV